MMDIDRVWARLAQRQEYQGRRLSDFVVQNIGLNVTLAPGASSLQQPAKFPAGAAILSVSAAATIQSAAATQTYRPGLEMFTVQIDLEQGRNLVPSGSIAAAVFGSGERTIFPTPELVMYKNAALQYSFVSLVTTQTILISVIHQALVPAAIG